MTKKRDHRAMVLGRFNSEELEILKEAMRDRKCNGILVITEMTEEIEKGINWRGFDFIVVSPEYYELFSHRLERNNPRRPKSSGCADCDGDSDVKILHHCDCLRIVTSDPDEFTRVAKQYKHDHKNGSYTVMHIDVRHQCLTPVLFK